MVDTFSGRTAGIVVLALAIGAGSAAAQGPGTIAIGDLPPGKTVTITFDAVIVNPPTGVSVENQGTVKGTNFADKLTDDPATGAVDDATVTPLDIVDVAVTKTDGVTSAVPGQSVVYTIVVSNAGPSNATSVSVADTFPAGLSCGWTSTPAGGATGNTNNAGPANLAETLNLPAGSSVTYTVTCAIVSSATGTLSNTVTATVNSLASDTKTELNTANNTATDNDTALTPQADLTITKSDSPDPVLAGEDLVYTIEVTNNGPSDAQGVQVTDTLPAVVTLVSTTGCAEDGSGGGVPVCTLGTIAAGASKQYSITVTVASSAADGSTLVNEASVGSSTTLINTGDDSVTESTTVQRSVDLVVTKTESADPVIAGSGSGNLTYVVTVKNDGPSDATGVALSEVLTLPSGVSIDSITPSGSTTYAPPNAAIGTWTVGSLAAGDSEILTVVLTVGSSTLTGTDVISDTAQVTTVNETDPNAGNNSDTEATSVLADGDFGDAPDPTYPTLLASNGALHVQPSALFLGAAVDIDPDGQPTADADGDDTDLDGDDEDGVIFTSSLVAGDTADVNVTASVGGGVLNAWLDFNGDGDWADAGEQVFTDEALAAGVNALSFAVPPDAVAGLTFARFRVSTSGGLSFDGLAADGEVEDYRVTIERQVEISVDLEDEYDPAVAGKVQLYSIEVTNHGPSDATGVEVAHTLPAGFFLGGEPTSFPCTLAGSTATCTIGDLPAGATETVTVGVLLDVRSDLLVFSTAVVSSNELDTIASNNSDLSGTYLARARSILPTSRGSTPALVIVAKEAEESVGLIGLEAAGGGNREYALDGIGLRPVDTVEVPNFTGGPSPELAVLSFGFDGSVRVLVYDVEGLGLLGSQTQAPAPPGAGGPRRIGPPARAAIYPVPGSLVPIDIEAVPDFAGTPAPELAVLVNDLSDGSVRVVVLDAGDGAILRNVIAVPAPDYFGLGMEVLFDFDGSPAPEVGLTARNRASGDIANVSVNLDAGAMASSIVVGGLGLFPLDVAAADLGGTPGPDLAFLTRRPSDGALAVQVVHLAFPTALLPEVGFDDNLMPVDLETVPNFAGGSAPELAVLGLFGSIVATEIRDGGTGALINTLGITSPPKIPVPLGLAVHPSFDGGPASEVSVLFEFFVGHPPGSSVPFEPTQTAVWDAAGASPLFTFVLP